MWLLSACPLSKRLHQLPRIGRVFPSQCCSSTSAFCTYEYLCAVICTHADCVWRGFATCSTYALRSLNTAVNCFPSRARASLAVFSAAESSDDRPGRATASGAQSNSWSRAGADSPIALGTSDLPARTESYGSGSLDGRSMQYEPLIIRSLIIICVLVAPLKFLCRALRPV